MTSVYLKCDSCGKTLGAEEVIKDRTPHWSGFQKLQDEARKRGWTGPLTRESSSDKCPECSNGEPGA